MVFAATWFHSYKIVRAIPQLSWFNKSVTLSVVMIRDGTLYFVALSLLNMADIIVSVVNTPVQNLVAFINPLTSILISRFLLDIREVASYSRVDVGLDTSSSGDMDIDTSTQSNLPTIEFTPHTVLGYDTVLNEGSMSAVALDDTRRETVLEEITEEAGFVEDKSNKAEVRDGLGA